MVDAVIFAPGAIIGIVGIGLFEANTSQFRHFTAIPIFRYRIGHFQIAFSESNEVHAKSKLSNELELSGIYLQNDIRKTDVYIASRDASTV